MKPGNRLGISSTVLILAAETLRDKKSAMDE
jgi:hypothetical protein